MPFSRAFDPASAFVYGPQLMLVLTDAVGMAEIERALLPLPLGASPHARHRTDLRDPFSDPDRPLRLTFASDVAMAPAREQRLLSALAHLHNVLIDVLPEVDVPSGPTVGRVSVSRRDEALSIVTTREPTKPSPGWYRKGAASALTAQAGIGSELAERLVLSISAHEALGNDYLVSPTLALHRDTRAFWGPATGACTVDEALFLAGLKGRLYRMVKMSAVIEITTGWLYETTATRLSPSFRRALMGALDPAADEGQSRSAPFLLAIRSRLRDLLVCRDELARLERREALGRDWPADAERVHRVVGGSGNDLAVRVAYHVTAGLNAMSTVLDNLAWVVAAREHIDAKPWRIGFDKLVRPADDFPPTRASDVVARGVSHRHPTRRALALRAIRNETDHGTGLVHGWAMSVRGASRSGPEMLAVWVPRSGLVYRLPEGEGRAADELDDVATVATGDVVLLRPRVLIESALACAAALSEQILNLYGWNSGRWLRRHAASGVDQHVLRLSRGRWHRALWGADLLPPGLHLSLRGSFGEPDTPTDRV